MTTNHFIVKTVFEGVKLISINDLKSQLFSLKHLLMAKDMLSHANDALNLYITH
jgi:hypothetical protein